LWYKEQNRKHRNTEVGSVHLIQSKHDVLSMPTSKGLKKY